MSDRDMRASVTALILAGGLGTRLRPTLKDVPKVLAPVRGRPFITYLLDQVRAAGIERVILLTGYMGERIEAEIGAHYRGLEISYSQEPAPLGTGGAVAHALPQLETEHALVMNGDSYIDLRLTGFYDWFVEAAHGEAGMVLAHVPDTSRYGRVEVEENGRFMRFAEKQAGRGLINAGVYLLSREWLEDLPSGRAVSLEYEMFPAWLERGLYGYSCDGRFIDIGTPDSYAQAEAFFEEIERRRGRRFVVLDRDGTIIVQKPYLSDPDEVELLDNAARGLRHLRELGLGIVVVTNQSGIGRGFFDEAQLAEVNDRIEALLAQEGVTLDRIYHCPSLPTDNAPCRKPNTGMIEQAAREFGFQPSDSFVVGDKDSDIEMGQRVGATSFLVRTGYGSEHIERCQPDYVVDDLYDMALLIQQLMGEPHHT